MRRMLRSLRLVVTAICGTLSVVLFLLWMRSYTRGDSIMIRTVGTHVVGIASNRGAFLLAASDLQSQSEIDDMFGAARVHVDSEESTPPPQSGDWDFGTCYSPYPTHFVVTPHWFPTLVL